MTQAEKIKAVKILQQERDIDEALLSIETDEDEIKKYAENVKAFGLAIHAINVYGRIEYLIQNTRDKEEPLRKKVTTVSLESLEKLIQ